MLKTILFDLDDTLLDFTASESAALARALAEAGLSWDRAVLARYHAINQRHWRLLEDGVLSRDQVLTDRFTCLLAELGSPASAQALNGRYEALLAAEHALVPGALELLETLHGRFDLYAASNGSTAVQRRRLAESGLLPYFRGVFLSQELGADKPQRAFFEACFAAIPNFSRETALLVGDSLTSDIRGGQDAGLRTCWFSPTGPLPAGAPRPDCICRSLAQLPGLLETL